MSDTFDAADDGADFETLLAEAPRLYRVRAFADALKGEAYFARLGEPLDGGDQAAARAFLDGLGFTDVEPAPLGDWDDAAEAALSLDFDGDGWEAEEMARAALTAAALDVVTDEGVRVALALVADVVGRTAKAAAEDAAALGDSMDRHVHTAAVGGAVQAAHGAALALLAAETGEEAAAHPLFARHQLYIRGRWPVGLAGRSLNIL